METVTLSIDGRQITVEKGKTVLQASIEAGISVPYYCYHPGISVDGSCRVCVVKIEKMPKLQTSCSMVATEGMVVSTRDPEVVDARAGVFEFLLVNHPLDCPVCDKGGECPLQDFSYTFGPAESRMDFPRRVFDGEGVRADVDFGPTLMLNRNRCILCTRCVRFMRDIDGDAQINIVDRGYGSEIATFQEEGVHSLLSGNLMDVCPVGAITTRDYRFKSRPWDNPNVVDTICTLCSKGCNTSAWLKAKPEWAKGSRLIRMTPRFNAEVNSYWMCDIGRFDYHWVEGDTRLRKPMWRRGDALENTAWHDVEPRMRDVLQAAGSADAGSVRFLASAHASTEELFVLKQLVEGLLGSDGLKSVFVSWPRSEKRQPPNTRFEVPPTDAPNVNGAKDLGYTVGGGNDGLPDLTGLRTAVEGGRVKALYVLDPGPDGSIGDVSWVVAARHGGTLPLLIVQGVVMTELAAAADFVLPGAAYVEKDALYTNDKGLVQGAAQAILPPGDAREDWQILVNLAASLGLTLPYRSDADVRRAIAAAMPGTPYVQAADIAFARALPARSWLQASNPSERWKWDFMYQDLPPVKGHNVQMEGAMPQGAIPLTPVGPPERGPYR
jgi:NADH-quinone oxidoreductase subunit G